MKKRNLLLMFSLFVALLFVMSCGKSKAVLAREELKTITGKMTEIILQQNQALSQLVTLVTSSYGAINWDGIDISKMDKKDGGEYYATNFGTQITRDVKGNGPERASIMSWGNKPADNTTKKMLKWLETSIEPKFKEIYKNIPYTISVPVFFTNEECVIVYPGYDHLSAIPWPQDFSNVDWFKYLLSLPSNPIRMPPAIGYSEGINTSVDQNLTLNGKTTGLILSMFKISKIIEDLLKDYTEIIFSCYTDYIVFGASPIAKTTLKIQVADEYDYLTRVQEVGLTGLAFPAEYKLNDKNQQADIIKLAELITKENITNEKLFITLNGKKYQVIIEQEPETQFFFVALI